MTATDEERTNGSARLRQTECDRPRPMVVARTMPSALDEPEVNVFACRHCGADFITEDHLTIAGTTAP